MLLQCELYHWIDILDIFDAILEDCCRKKDGQWILPVDLSENAQVSCLPLFLPYLFTTTNCLFTEKATTFVRHLIYLSSH